VITPERRAALAQYRVLWLEALEERLSLMTSTDFFIQVGNQRVGPQVAKAIGVDPKLLRRIWNGRVPAISEDLLAEIRECYETVCQMTDEEVSSQHIAMCKSSDRDSIAERNQYMRLGGIDPEKGMAWDRRRDRGSSLNINVGIAAVVGPGNMTSGQIMSMEGHFSEVWGEETQRERIAGCGVREAPAGSRLGNDVGRPDAGVGGNRALPAADGVPTEPPDSHEQPAENAGANEVSGVFDKLVAESG
jgi:hypothetical protein